MNRNHQRRGLSPYVLKSIEHAEFLLVACSIPVDPLEWQVTPEVANDVAACVANTVGAAEGVLRVAASGRDSKLFTKVG